MYKRLSQLFNKSCWIVAPLWLSWRTPMHCTSNSPHRERDKSGNDARDSYWLSWCRSHDLTVCEKKTSWKTMEATGCYDNSISEWIRKKVPARFSPRSGRSLDLGWASDSKPRGVSVTAALATLFSHWPLCWWLAGGQLSKAGGMGACFVLAPLLVKTLSFQC